MYPCGLFDHKTGKAILLDSGAYLIYRDKLKGPGSHYGVLFIGPETGYLPVVYHLEVKGHREGSMADFARGKLVFIGDCNSGPGALATAIDRARALMQKQQAYDLLAFNCEHLARAVVFGKSRSKQVEGLLALVFVGVIVWAVAK